MIERTYPLLDMNHPMFHETPDKHRNGTHDYELSEFDDIQLSEHSHTHCSECDVPYKFTHHFMGDGIICSKCSHKRWPKLCPLDDDEDE